MHYQVPFSYIFQKILEHMYQLKIAGVSSIEEKGYVNRMYGSGPSAVFY